MLALVIFALLVHFSIQDCPTGTVPGLTSDTCYYFVKKGDDHGSLFEAYCGFNDFANGSKILGYGQFTSIMSAFEQTFVLNQAKQYLQSDYHIGMFRKYPNYDGDHYFDYYWLDGNDLSYTNWDVNEPKTHALEDGLQEYVSVNINTGKWYSSGVVTIVNNSGVVNWAPLVCKVPAQAPKCVDHLNASQGFSVPLYNPMYNDLTKKCYYNVYVMPENVTAGYIVDKNSCGAATKDVSLALTKISTIEEASVLARFNDYGATISYIGLFYDSTSKSWSWSDGSSLTINHWDTGYPQDPENNSCAGYIYPNGGQTHVEENTDGYPKWRNFPCDTSKVGYRTVTLFCQVAGGF